MVMENVCMLFLVGGDGSQCPIPGMFPASFCLLSAPHWGALSHLVHQKEWTAFSSSLWSKVTSENSTPFLPKSEVMKSKRSKYWPHDPSPKLIHASANVASSLRRFTNIFTFICPCVHAKSLQSCLTLCDPVNCSLPGSSVHRILQARILEWVAVPSSRGSSQTRAWTHFSCVSCIGRWVCCHWGSHLRTCKMATYLPSNLCSPGPTHCSE